MSAVVGPIVVPALEETSSEATCTDLARDVEWKEFNYHNGEGHATSSSTVKESKSAAFQLFPSQCDDDDDVDDENDEFSFKYPGLPMITIRGESSMGNTKIFKVTGLGIWSSELLCEYLVKHSDLVRGRRVLELGAGTGLAGIVAHHLGAKRAVLTDGDIHALENMRHNAMQNTTTTTNPDDDDEVLPCPQLIWGDDLGVFAGRYGTFQVLMACDCIYMNKCLQPFWETVDALLDKTAQSSILVYVNTCPSQATLESFSDAGRSFGMEEFNDDACTVAQDIHFFRRRK